MMSANEDLSIVFVVPGVPVGYTTHNRKKGGGAHRVSRAILKYWNYLSHVREQAELAGLLCPIESDPEDPIDVHVYPFFKNRVHPDPGNVEKGIKDALFYKAKSADKYTGGSYAPPMYDKDNPRVVVVVRRHQRHRGPSGALRNI
jgi:hypothetical protein